MVNSLQKEWEQRCKLRDKGDKLCGKAAHLYDEGRKLRDEGDKLRTKGEELWGEGDKLWYEGVNHNTEAMQIWYATVAAEGLTVVSVNAGTCTLSNGEIYHG